MPVTATEARASFSPSRLRRSPSRTSTREPPSTDAAHMLRSLARSSPAPTPSGSINPLHTQDAQMLEIDLNRAGRQELGISDEDAEFHREALRRLLFAFCELRPAIGYVQGLNCIGAALLVICDHAEDEAIVLLVLLIDRLPSDWYLDSLKGGRVEVGALLRLYEARKPELFSVGELRLALHVTASSWLLSLFVSCFNSELLAVAWYALLTDTIQSDSGAPGSNLRVVLVLLARVEKELAASLRARVDDPDSNVYAVLKRAADGLQPDDLQRGLDATALTQSELVAARSAARAELEGDESALTSKRASRQRQAKMHGLTSRPRRARVVRKLPIPCHCLLRALGVPQPGIFHMALLVLFIGAACVWRIDAHTSFVALGILMMVSVAARICGIGNAVHENSTRSTRRNIQDAVQVEVNGGGDQQQLQGCVSPGSLRRWMRMLMRVSTRVECVPGSDSGSCRGTRHGVSPRTRFLRGQGSASGESRQGNGRMHAYTALV